MRAEIAELRKKAGGLVGRIANAINRFIDDPVKFIIEGLLELLGIPPAAFWAVVAKIKKVVKDIADDPMKLRQQPAEGARPGLRAVLRQLRHAPAQGLPRAGCSAASKGVQMPKDVSLKSIVTFFLQLMGITWPNIRKILVKQIGAKNVALIEKVYSLVSLLIEKGPEGIFEMIKEKLDPAVDRRPGRPAGGRLHGHRRSSSRSRRASSLLFNPAGAILQALEAIYRVLKWIFQNAAQDLHARRDGGERHRRHPRRQHRRLRRPRSRRRLAMLIAPVHRLHRRLPQPRRPAGDRRREDQEHAASGSSA